MKNNITSLLVLAMTIAILSPVTTFAQDGGGLFPTAKQYREEKKTREEIEKEELEKEKAESSRKTTTATTPASPSRKPIESDNSNEGYKGLVTAHCNLVDMLIKKGILVESDLDTTSQLACSRYQKVRPGSQKDITTVKTGGSNGKKPKSNGNTGIVTPEQKKQYIP